MKGYETTIWLGVMAPAGTPKPVIDRLNAEIDKIVARPDVKKAWNEQGAEPMSMTAGRIREIPERRHRQMGEGGQGFGGESGLERQD